LHATALHLAPSLFHPWQTPEEKAARRAAEKQQQQLQSEMKARVFLVWNCLLGMSVKSVQIIMGSVLAVGVVFSEGWVST
jgi:hypothetical protein